MKENPIIAAREKVARLSAEKAEVQTRVNALATTRSGLLKDLATGSKGASSALVAHDSEAASLSQRAEGLDLLLTEARALLAPLEEEAQREAAKAEAARQAAELQERRRTIQEALDRFFENWAALNLEYGRLHIMIGAAYGTDRAAASNFYRAIREHYPDLAEYQELIPAENAGVPTIAPLVRRKGSPLAELTRASAADARMLAAMK